MWMWNEGIIGLLICGVITTILVVITTRKWASGNERFPPGPFSWRVMGHVNLFSSLPHQTLREISRKYGSIVGLRLGQQRAVVVSSVELAKEVLTTLDKLFANRPPFEFTSIAQFGTENGLVFGKNGPAWRNRRKICMIHLFTAKRLQDLEYVRQEEVRTLLHSIHDQSSGGIKAVDVGICVGQMSSRLIMRLLRSKPNMQVAGENLQDLIRAEEHEMGPTMGDLVPSLSLLDFFRKRHMRRIHASLDKVCTEILMERKESTSLHDDLLQALLSQEEPLTVVEIKSILIDIMGAAIHTTALNLEWAMAELLSNPRCLHRLQREIDTQLDEKKQVISDADVQNMSYLKCIVKEVSRLHPAAPLLLPRIAKEECKLQGYTIPEKTIMFVNVWAIARDEKLWPNANEFMPERFEGKDMDLKGQNFELLPFGSGRRICLGLTLALSIVEVTLANLVRNFDWELPHGEIINMDEKKGVALAANKATPVIAIPKPRVSLPNI